MGEGACAVEEKPMMWGLTLRDSPAKLLSNCVTSMCNDLANLYQSQVRYAEAEPIDKRSHAIVEKAFGAEHPDVGQLLNNLAVLYRLEHHACPSCLPLFDRLHAQ